ncbi:hypothetical protein K3495_g14725 [Podosphaera aphanis]|nr:hypothetical protein K3495_g14725 [Podosphaera aphanis]
MVPNTQGYQANAVTVEPTTYQQAIQSNDSELWKFAIEEEMDALKRNKTWKVVPIPTDQNIVGSRWVFKIKHKADGSIERYKARLVAKGFSQQPGIDYDDTYAPVARFESLRLLLALATHKGWIPRQLGVKSAFLYGKLDCEIFMQIPDGYKLPGKCYLLRKSIYGLKQSPLVWYSTLSAVLKKDGFAPTNFDPCVFVSLEKFVHLAIYVDDILMFGPDQNSIDSLVNSLHSEFQFGTPLDPGTQLRKGNPEELIDDPTIYQSIIGSLMYACVATRPDLAHAVTLLSQFSSCPSNSHLVAAKRVLRYLKGTADWNLYYPRKNEFTLRGFTDSSYGNFIDDRKSCSGYIFRLGEATISWSSKKQKTVALSTTEAEYIAMSDAACYMIWVKNALSELNQPYKPIMHADSNGGIDLSRNHRISQRSKHIDIRYHFIRSHVDSTFSLGYIPSNNNLADLLPKQLPKSDHQRLSDLVRCSSEGKCCKEVGP